MDMIYYLANNRDDSTTTNYTLAQARDTINLIEKLFERDYTNDIYKVENTTEFFLGKDNFLYLIYAYGNDNYTSELDLVIF